MRENTTSWVLVVIAVLVALGCHTRTVREAWPNERLEGEIEARLRLPRSSFRTGESISLHLQLRNISTNRVTYLDVSYGTGLFNGYIELVIQRATNTVRASRQMINPRPVRQSDIKTLQPGSVADLYLGSLTDEDAPQHWSLPKGSYTVRCQYFNFFGTEEKDMAVIDTPPLAFDVE